uniref:Tensin 4 n=1 Tax=Seriola dumerili TaxID=41447 RepID=A0A3B4TJ71_SERDU
MMPTAKGMSHMIPNHVLRVGQTIRLDSAQETVNQHPSLPKPSGDHGDPDLDISLDNLNQLIMELDPTFEPIQVNTSPSNLSLASEDDSPESIFTSMSGSCSDVSRMRPFDNRHSPEKPLLTKKEHLHSKGGHSSPASLSGSLTDIPVLLVNGAPQPDLYNQSPGPQIDLIQIISASSPKPAPHSESQVSQYQPSMKFVMDTSKFWFRPHISRAEDKEAGAFVVRDSTSYRGSFGLAMKVDPTPNNFTATAYPGESSSDVVRHFLIESSAKGVRIKGASQEPYFGKCCKSQHHLLYCTFICYQFGGGYAYLNVSSNFIYLNAVPTEMLTGPCAVQKAVSSTLQKTSGSFIPTVVNLKVSLKGVTLTDINRKLFFRRHYPTHLLSYSGEDPDNRLWVKGCSFGARMFGFVAKGVDAGMENVCHVFAEYDPLQPCNKVIEVIQGAIAKL